MTRDQVSAHALAVGRKHGVEVLVEEPLAPYLSMRVGGPRPLVFLLDP